MARKTIRSVVQRLESLQRAGVTHVKKVGKRTKAPTSGEAIERLPVKMMQPAKIAMKVAPAEINTASSKTTGTTTSSACFDTRAKESGFSVNRVKGDSPIFVDHRCAAVPAKIGTVPTSPTDQRCAALAEIAREVAACTRCKELAETRTQTVFGVGNPYTRLVFCGEAPGADEDRQGEPFVGRAGQLLNDIIVKGMKMRREDVYILNILRCRPPGNRAPLPNEAANCREYLDRQLAIIQPQFICCLGAVAAQNLLGTDTSIGELRGRLHDLHGITVVCTYHPAYLLRNPAAKRPVWDDIQMLMAEMSKKG